MKFIAWLFGIPLLIGIAAWIIQSLANPSSPQVIEKVGELIAQAAIPWWVPVLQFIVGIPIVGGTLGVAFLFLLARENSIEG